jgi:hypothetical protein
VLHPRHAWIIQVAGTLFLLALGLAFHFVPGLGFESGLLLLLAFAMVVGLVVLAKILAITSGPLQRDQPPSLHPQCLEKSATGRSLTLISFEHLIHR